MKVLSPKNLGYNPLNMKVKSVPMVEKESGHRIDLHWFSEIQAFRQRNELIIPSRAFGYARGFSLPEKYRLNPQLN